MITLAFGDPDLSNSEKEEKVKTLKVLIFPIPIEFQHSLHVELDNLDFSSNAPPSLVNFIEENSYFIFLLLGITKNSDVPKLSCPTTFWPSTQQYVKLERFVKSLEIVNDSSESAIQLVTDFITSTLFMQKMTVRTFC